MRKQLLLLTLVGCLESQYGLAQTTAACALSQTNDTLDAIRTEAMTSLGQIRDAEKTCGAEIDTAAGNGGIQGTGSRIDTALQAMQRVTLPQTRCQSVEETVSARHQTLTGLMGQLSASTVAAPSEVEALGSSPFKAEGSWSSFKLVVGPAPEVSAYAACSVWDSATTTQYVNTTCVQSVDDLEVYRASAVGAQSAQSGERGGSGGGGSICGAKASISQEVANGIATALTTALSIAEHSSKCPAGPRAAASAMNLGISVLTMTPVSPLISLLAGIGQRLFNGALKNNLKRGQEGIDDITWDTTRRQAQCLFMSMHKLRLGCDSNPQNLEDIQKRVDAKKAKIAQLAGLQSNYLGRYNTKAADDYNRCVNQSNNAISHSSIQSIVDGWGLGAVEDLFNPPQASAAAVPAAAQAQGVTVSVNVNGAAAGAASVEPTINTVFDKLGPACSNFRDSKSSVAATNEIKPFVERLQRACDNLDSQTVAQIKGLLFAPNGLSLSRAMKAAIDRLPPSVEPDPLKLLTDCENALETPPNPARKKAIEEIRGLEREIRDMLDPQAELTAALASQATSISGTSGTEIFNSFRNAWTRSNGTELNLFPRLSENVNNIKQICTAPRPESRALIQAANELHGTCLLNAGVYLYGTQTSPDFTSRPANDWSRACSYFLNNNKLSPQSQGHAFNVGQTDADPYNEWQCKAMSQFPQLRSNLQVSLFGPAAEPARRAFCDSFNRVDGGDGKTPKAESR